MNGRTKAAAAPRQAGPFEERDLLGQYLEQISRTPLLSAEQEVELAERIEAGVYADELVREAKADRRELPAEGRRELQMIARDGQHGKDHMIRANLRLVVSVARKHSRRGLPFLDVT